MATVNSTNSEMIGLLKTIRANGGKIAAFPGDNAVREIILDCAVVGYLDPCYGGKFQITESGNAVCRKG